MKTFLKAFVVIGVFAVSSQMQAATAIGSLTVVGQILSSISLTVDTPGGVVTLGGTPLAATVLGTTSKFGTTPAGFTKTVDDTSWTLNSTIGVKVVKANLVSSSYTLNASLLLPPASGVVWSLNDLPLSSSSTTAITTSGTYGTTANYPWKVQIPDSLTSLLALDNSVQFSAISN